MADYASEVVGWYSWLTELSLLPQEYQYIIRVISGFFVRLLLLPNPPGPELPLTRSAPTQITLALTPIVPIAGLVIYDFALWVWRLTAASLSASSTTRIAVAADLPKPLTAGITPDGLPEPNGPLDMEDRVDVGILQGG